MLGFISQARLENMKQTEAPKPVRTVPQYFEPVSISNRGTFHFNGDLLYWKFYNNGLPFVMESVFDAFGTGGNAVILFKDLKVVNVPMKNDFGLRVGAGYTIPYGEFDFNLSWTRFHSANSKTESTDTQGGLVPLWTFIDVFVGAEEQNIKAKMKIHFDTLDLDMSRFFFVRSVLAFKPVLGVKASRILQKERISQSGLFTTGSGVVEVKGSVDLENEFKGIGLRGGFDLRFILPRGFEIYGTTFYSLLMGQFDSSQKQLLDLSQVSNNAAFRPFSTHNRGNLHQNITVFEMGAGLKWGRIFIMKKRM